MQKEEAKKRYRRYSRAVKEMCRLKYLEGTTMRAISEDMDVPIANLYVWRRKWRKEQQEANNPESIISGSLAGVKLVGTELLHQAGVLFHAGSYAEAARMADAARAIAVMLDGKSNEQSDVVWGKAELSELPGGLAVIS